MTATSVYQHCMQRCQVHLPGSHTLCCCAVFQLERKFASEYNMLCLHMWMLLVRLRSEGKDGKALAQMVYETFQDNVETRVRAEGVKVSSDCVLQYTLCVVTSSALAIAGYTHVTLYW